MASVLTVARTTTGTPSLFWMERATLPRMAVRSRSRWLLEAPAKSESWGKALGFEDGLLEVGDWRPPDEELLEDERFAAAASRWTVVAISRRRWERLSLSSLRQVPETVMVILAGAVQVRPWFPWVLMIWRLKGDAKSP